LRLTLSTLLSPWQLFSAFLLASLVLAVTSGPGVLHIVARSLVQRHRSGLTSVAGVAIGNLGNALAACEDRSAAAATPRAHRHGAVLAPNALPGAVVTALARAVVPPAATFATREELRHRAIARYLWALLLARIHETLPLSCPICHSPMRIIALVKDAGTVTKILDHIGESAQPPRTAPGARASAVGGGSSGAGGERF